MHDETVTVFHERTQVLRQRRRIVLRLSVPGQQEQRIELTQPRIALGQSRSNPVVVEHESVSGAHAELHQVEDWIELVDLGSRNGSVRLGELWGGGEVMREMFVQLAAFASANINLLITGKTGTAKELAARAVHSLSPRARRPFVVVDCGKLVPAFATSAFFGHAKGAFTGADRNVPGAFEVAHGGTIFLDKIGELSLDLQTTLLRVLDRGEVTRIGEHKPKVVDVRVVAATHRNLSAMVAAGTFRESLYFRLVEGEVEMPPLALLGTQPDQESSDNKE